MNTTTFPTDAPIIDAVRLEVRVANTPEQQEQALAALDAEHRLGAGRTAGHALWQLVFEGQQLCAVILWCACAFRLKDRDLWIGWDDVTRAKRLKLIVQNRRFLVLEAARRPNLASQCMGAALRALPAQWQLEHGYKPLLAESFSDPQTHAGTTYKVTNWLPLGHTQGYSQKRPQAGEHKADFYIRNEAPKRLWVKELDPKARQLLCARELAPQHEAALTAGAGGRSPLKVPQLRSLHDAFADVTDPRNPKSRRHPLRAMLSLLCLGLLQGARNAKDIWRKVTPLSQRHRAAIGLTVREKGSTRLMMPGYDALNDLLGALDPKQLSQALSTWLSQHHGTLPRSLAIDGKDIHAVLGSIITLCDQRTGAPVAMTSANGTKKDTELTEAQRMLDDPNMDHSNAVITADALHTQAQSAQIIIEKGGDYLFALKSNQKSVLAAAKTQLEGAPFFVQEKSPPRMGAWRSGRSTTRT